MYINATQVMLGSTLCRYVQPSHELETIQSAKPAFSYYIL